MNLLPLYTGTAIFGLGVLIIDMLGVLSSIGDDGGDGDSGDDMGADSGEDGDGDSGDEFGGESGENGDDGSGHDNHGSYTLHSKTTSKNIVLRSISVLRSLVYFSLGFGAIGWFALYKGKGQIESLIWSLPFGLFIMAITKIVKRIQRSELDSQFKKHELLMSEAKVIVPIKNSGIGKIRIDYEGINIERYAKAQNPNNFFNKGDTVTVVDISDEYFFVE